MCNQPKPEKFLRNYPVSFKRELWQSIPTDVLFVTKEKLQIGAHKVVLAALDKFWFSLLQDVKGCAGVCPSEPLYVFLPEYDYQTVMLYIQSYYQENVKVPKKKTEDFKSLVRNFDKTVMVSETKCRICGEKVNTQILHHIIEHVKTAAKTDKQKAIQDYTQEIRCSFSSSGLCKLEYDRGVFANGLFNDRHCHSTNDMIQTINQHYRRHLRDEMNYMKDEGIKVPGDDMETSFWHLAEISDYISPEKEHSADVGLGEVRIPYVSAGDRVEGEADDYSGGMSSPSSSSSSDIEQARLEKSDNDEGRKSALGSQKYEAETSRQMTCKKCKQMFKSNVGFRKHIIKELSSELEHFLLNGHNSNILDKESNTCKVQNCKNHGKSFTNLSFLVQHVCTVHNMLEEYLKSKGQTIDSWDSYTHVNRLSLDATSLNEIDRPESRNTNNSDNNPHPDSKNSGMISRPESRNTNNSDNTLHPDSKSSGKRPESRQSSTTDEAATNRTHKKLKPSPESETTIVEKDTNEDGEGVLQTNEMSDDDDMSDDMWVQFKDKLIGGYKNQDDENINEEKSQGSSSDRRNGDENDEGATIHENTKDKDDLVDSESDKDTLPPSPPVPMDTHE